MDDITATPEQIPQHPFRIADESKGSPRYMPFVGVWRYWTASPALPASSALMQMMWRRGGGGSGRRPANWNMYIYIYVYKYIYIYIWSRVPCCYPPPPPPYGMVPQEPPPPQARPGSWHLRSHPHPDPLNSHPETPAPPLQPATNHKPTLNYP